MLYVIFELSRDSNQLEKIRIIYLCLFLSIELYEFMKKTQLELRYNIPFYYKFPNDKMFVL